MNKCFICGIVGIVPSKTDYKYLEGGGLDITLRGIQQNHCTSCEDASVLIPNIEGLDRVLVDYVIKQPRRLCGNEFRFLRKMLGWTATEFAEHFQTPKTTISKWEHQSQIPSPPVDLLIRTLAAESLEIPFTLITAPNIRQKCDAPERISPITVRFQKRAGEWALEMNNSA